MASAHAAAVEEANNQFSEQSPGQQSCVLSCFAVALRQGTSGTHPRLN